ncbi:MAG: hypothetical protein RJA44_2298 [Pseudomonadota bacterium]
MERGQSLDDLLGAVALRDQVAFGLLYQRTSAHLLGLILRLHNGDRGAAENVLEQVYVEVWHGGAERFDPAREQALVWLMSLARQRALERRLHHPPPPVERDPMSDQPPLELVCTALLARANRRSMRLLDIPEQQSFALAYYQGMNRHELVEHFGMPMALIKSSVRRALQVLRGNAGPDETQSPQSRF